MCTLNIMWWYLEMTTRGKEGPPGRTYLFSPAHCQGILSRFRCTVDMCPRGRDFGGGSADVDDAPAPWHPAFTNHGLDHVYAAKDVDTERMLEVLGRELQSWLH